MKKLIMLTTITLALALTFLSCTGNTPTESVSENTSSPSVSDTAPESADKDGTEAATESETESEYTPALPSTAPSTEEAETDAAERPSFEEFASLRKSDSNLVSTPTSVMRIGSAADIPSPAPNAVIVKYSNGMAGGVLIEEFMTALNGETMPIFEISDLNEADSLVKAAEAFSIKDYFALSADTEVLSYISSEDPNVRGILDRTSVDSADADKLLELRRELGKSFARILLINEKLADRTTTRRLQGMLVPVWVDGGESDSKTELVKNIVSGASGIVTASLGELEAAYTAFFGASTIVNPMYIIGHRGVPSQAPENTIVSATMAYDYGADIIENDIRLSKDGAVIVMHDSDVSRTTDGKGKVEELTLDELKKFRVTKQYGKKYPDAEIPTLGEYFEAFRDNDGSICIEVKTTDENIVPAMMQVIGEHSFESRAFVITFSKKIIEKLKETAPEIPVGLLVSNDTKAPSKNELLSRVAEINEEVGTLHTIYNPYCESMTEDLVDALTARGIVVCPWGINNVSAISRYRMWGVMGIATDNSHQTSSLLKTIDCEKTEYSANAGDELAIPYSVTRYDRTNEEIKPKNLSVTVIEGAEFAKAEIGESGEIKVTAVSSGKVSLIISYASDLRKTGYRVTSEVIEIDVK